MLTQTLTCAVIGFSTQPFSHYTDAAQEWIGNTTEFFLRDNSITWMEHEIFALEESDWLRKPPERQNNARTSDPLGEIDIPLFSRRTVAKLASVENKDVIAVITSFSAVTAALQDHLTSSVNKEALDLSLDLASFHRTLDRNGFPPIRTITGISSDSKMAITLSPSQLETNNFWVHLFLERHELISLTFSLENLQVRLYTNMAMHIEGNINGYADVENALSKLMELLKNSVRFSRHDSEFALVA